MAFQTWADFAAWLDRKGLFHMELGLERMEKALRILGLGKLPFAVAQVVGTNGKGSTATFLAALAEYHGLETGLYTSPHILSPKERILINGRQLSDNAWLQAANAIQDSAAGDLGLSYFEFLTVLALMLFKNAGVEAAIMEAGLGGKNDATTAIAADVLCFTPVAMDHAAIIGPTLRDIAKDKACAIRGSAPVFSAPQFPAAREELLAAAGRHGVEISFPALAPDMLGLAGPHQSMNAALALAAWHCLASQLGITPGKGREAAAFAHAFIPGRLQYVPATDVLPALLLDGAHNPHGMRALVEHLEKNSITPRALIFSCLADKDWQSGFTLLRKALRDAPVLVVELANARACAGENISSCCAARGGGRPKIFRGPRAMEMALAACGPGGDARRPVLMCGSFYLLAEFFSLHPQYLQASGANELC